MKLNSFPHYLQLDAMDCGPSCLRMIAKYYGKSYSLQTLRARSFITREGVSMLGISDAAESIGFRTSGVRISLEQLKKDVPLPCILHWNQNHFVVCYDIKKKRRLRLPDSSSSPCPWNSGPGSSASAAPFSSPFTLVDNQHFLNSSSLYEIN